jgi:hypothetical protein
MHGQWGIKDYSRLDWMEACLVRWERLKDNHWRCRRGPALLLTLGSRSYEAMHQRCQVQVSRGICRPKLRGGLVCRRWKLLVYRQGQKKIFWERWKQWINLSVLCVYLWQQRQLRRKFQRDGGIMESKADNCIKEEGAASIVEWCERSSRERMGEHLSDLTSCHLVVTLTKAISATC